MKAVWKGTVIAESSDIVTVEGNAYFPLASADRRYLVDSTTHTVCGWKGQASYFSVRVGDEVNQDAAWYYPDPMKGAEAVTGRLAFWRGVTVEP
jgi:uncharacterized protein (DUF427 family)